MSMKEAYEKKLQSQLDEWNAEIDKLKAKVNSAEADTQIEYYQQLEDLRERHREVKSRLEELREASDDAWDDLKAGIDNAWDSLRDSIKSARSHFK